jgi:hypothetical protein
MIAVTARTLSAATLARSAVQTGGPLRRVVDDTDVRPHELVALGVR